MDFNRLTIKSGEAVAGAQELARRLGQPELYPEHLLLALLDQELPRTLVERAGGRAAALRSEAEVALRGKPSLSGGNVQPQRRRVRSAVCSTRRSSRCRRSATSSSRSSTSCSRSSRCRATRCSRRCRTCAAGRR